MQETITDLMYAAIEPAFNRIRLAYDRSGCVYIIGSPEFPYSAPFSVALTGTVYNEFMQEKIINEIEFLWVNKVKSFAWSLSLRND